MGLTDTVNGIMEDLKKRENKQDVWLTLEKKMEQSGFGEQYNKIINGMDSSEAYEFLEVWDAIDKHLNKKKLHRWRYKDESFNVIKTLSKISHIEEVIKTLGDSGYELPLFNDVFNYLYLQEYNLKIFEELAKDELYKRYGSIFEVLKKLGYKEVSNYGKSVLSQIGYILDIARLKGDAVGAIYVLASNGYKIGNKGLGRLNISSIEKIMEEDKKEKSEERIPVYLYKKGNVELFQEYFNSIEVENKKSVLRLILDYEAKEEPQEQNNQIREWIEKNYESLLREVGFEE